MNEAYVVTANAAVEAVVLGSETYAEDLKEKMARADYEVAPHRYKDYAAYRRRVYWNVDTVPLHEEKKS